MANLKNTYCALDVPCIQGALLEDGCAASTFNVDSVCLDAYCACVYLLPVTL